MAEGGRHGVKLLTSLVGVGDGWQELHMLASEPWGQHMLMAELGEDATNGLFSALHSSAVCTAIHPVMGKSSLAM